MRKITEAELKGRVEVYGFQLVTYGGSQAAKSLLRCQNGHEELKSLNTITANGVKCKTCAAGARSLAYSTTESEARRIVEAAGFELVEYGGDVYRKKSVVRCANGHERSVRIGNIIKGHGCKACVAESQLISEQNVAGRLPEGVHLVRYAGRTAGASVFRCDKGHEWGSNACVVMSQQTKCPKCSNNVSDMERDLVEFVASLGVEFITSDRKTIAPYELDIVIPSKKIAIEFNGVYWHSEAAGKKRQYHITKRRMCEAQGLRLISVRSDLWAERRQHIERIIKQAVNGNIASIGARKCKIVTVTSKDAWAFCDGNHVQGGAKSSVAYGLEYNGSLVAVMTATHWRKKDEWELSRFCTSVNVAGALSRLWGHIVNVHEVTSAFTFTDRDLFTGGAYASAGFTFKSCTVGFRVAVGKRTESRQKWNKAPDGLTQTEWYERERVSRIWDSGQDRLEWKKAP